jgi:ADP-heptose:LPS heptosyltransferase
LSQSQTPKRLTRKIETESRLLQNRLALFTARSYIKSASLPTSEAPTDVKSILVFKLDELGDVILAASFLKELRGVYPEASITFVVKSSSVQAVSACPYVDRVVDYPGPTKAGMAQLTTPINFGRELSRQGPYDLSINLRWDKDAGYAAVMAVFAKANYRVGFSENAYPEKAREYKGFDALYTSTIMCEPQMHEVAKGRLLLESICGPIASPIASLEFWSPREAVSIAKISVANLGVDQDQRYITICPSYGRSALKAWPIDRFTKLVAELRARYKLPIVFVGSDEDSAAAKEILVASRDRGVTSLCGKLSICESAEVVRGSCLYIGCDSGLSHVAAAVGTPQVTLFGSSCSHRFHPWSPAAHTVVVELPCGPCAPPHTQDRCVTCIYDTPKCMESILVADVLNQVQASAFTLDRHPLG